MGLIACVSLRILCMYSLSACAFGYAIEPAKEPSCSKFPYEEALLEKMVRMEFAVEKMFDGIKETQSDVKHELGKLKSERELVKSEREEFDNKVKEERTEFESKLETQEKDINEHLKHAESVINRLSEDLQDLRNGTIQDIINKSRRSTVLFRASNVANRNPSNDHKLIFQTVLENQGEGYNKDTGVFTAPEDGEYLFSVQICTYNNGDFYFAFVEDGVTKQPAELDNQDNSCGTAIYLTELKKNSEMWIQSLATHGTVLRPEGRVRSNSFSGILINSK